VKVLKSNIDRSVNFILPTRHVFEARYVQRDETSKIFYVSSQSGCSQGCRFCHLTATKQTAGVHATVEDYVRQVDTLVEHSWDISTAALDTYVNFMARGEVLVNPNFTRGPWKVLQAIKKAIPGTGKVKFKLSTILPVSLPGDLDQLCWGHTEDFQVDLYVSYYSHREKFRRKWMPRAAHPSNIRRQSLIWTSMGLGRVYFHRALIAGENDGLDDARRWCEAVLEESVTPSVNLIAYNPPPGDNHLSASPERIERIAEITREYFPTQVQIVPKVGYDVKASCGMFVERS